MMTELEKLAGDLVGKKYKWKGKNKEEGFGCEGLIFHIFRELGYKEIEVMERNFEKHQNELPERWYKDTKIEYYINELEKYCYTIPRGEIGDIVLFKIEAEVYHHGGLLVLPNKFIHSIEKHGVVISRLDKNPWKEAKKVWYRYVYKRG